MPEKSKANERGGSDEHELETQVVLRLPVEPAQVLRETLREGGPNLKERLTVKLEHDLRYGEVRLDHWLMYAKLVDLPTITESLKTIDGKNFYKAADVGQMLLCKYEPDAPTTDDESPAKNKKKDPNKVDKKYLWPHGITPPCKNVRKRRFRKTLKKKCVEAPEIEKEVKRLLRADNEAVQVKWDIVLEEEAEEDEEEDTHKTNMMLGNDESTSQSMVNIDVAGTSQQHNKTTAQRAIEDSSDLIPCDIDIFGENLSSSDDDDNKSGHLSADDSRSNFSNAMAPPSGNDPMATEFNKQMFNKSPTRARQTNDSMDVPNTPSGSNYRECFTDERLDADDNDGSMPQMTQDEIQGKIADLRRQLNDLRDQRIAKEQEISSIENETLRQRMQDALDNILSQTIEKEMELHGYESMAV